MNVWTTILAAGLGSYVLRMSMISSDRFRLPAQLDGAATLVAPAAFAALAVTTLAGLALAGLQHSGVRGALPLTATLAVASFAVARTSKPYLAVLTGMPTFWLPYFGVDSIGDARLVLDMMVGAQQRLMIYPRQGFMIEQEIPDDVAAAFEAPRMAASTAS